MIVQDSTPKSTRIEGEIAPHSPRGSSDRAPAAGDLAAILEEFDAAWKRGECPPAESFLRRHSWLTSNAEAAIRLIYEEICLRQAGGKDASVTEFVNRFPQWQSELVVLFDCDRLIGAVAPPEFPSVGETLGEFLLVAEIGRGARGRCFLAVQPSLSYRQVVLKVTPDDHAEHLSLARLQHTHIMPLYSEHEFKDRRIRALCMPYLGGATLSRIFAARGEKPEEYRSGREFLDALDRTEETKPWPRSSHSPARRFLAQASHEQVICWMGACLADALEYAHDRGLVHMDVKPSNILVTADGQPMLLDFHLAREPIPRGPSPVDGVGGTHGYMSPEQTARIMATYSADPSLPAIDARSDVYSLGRVLSDLIGAEERPPLETDRTRSPSAIRTASPGLSDVIQKCLSASPEARYSSAAALADDLRRHMADQPLRGVPNRSWRERWRKWCRRRAYESFRLKTLLVVAAAAVAIVGVLYVGYLSPRFRAATDALRRGRDFLDHHDYTRAARELTRGLASIEGLPGNSRLSEELSAALKVSDRLENADRLHQLADRVRFAEAAADASIPPPKGVEEHCRAVWQSRSSLLENNGEPLDPELERRIRDDLLDMALIGSDLRVRWASDPVKAAHARRAALAILGEAEAEFGSSHLLCRAKQAHASALGLVRESAASGLAASRALPRTAWEHDAVGRLLLAAGELAEAATEFEKALALSPDELWPNFHQGVCAFRRGRYDEAVDAFRVCVALAPKRAECFYNRALAYAAMGHTASASRDFGRAVSLDPSLASFPPTVDGRPVPALRSP